MTAAAACPKRMVYGPCGGVDQVGDCEVAGVGRCPFLDDAGPAVAPGTRAPATGWFLDLLATRPVVLTDLPARPLDAESLARCAAQLAGAADAVLLGDHPGERVQFPPALRALLVAAAGLAPWPVLTCRDRNRVALEAELAALATLDVAGGSVALAGAHCVTGDHPARGHRPDAAAVFDLDATRLTALAAAAGVVASVAAAPASPPGPVGRAAILASKVGAGAALAVVDHAGGAGPVEQFVAIARAAGVTVPFLACVPIVTDVTSAALLRSFPGITVPAGYLESIIEAPDPRRAGIAAAVTYAEELLAVPDISGVNLSGGARAGDEEASAADLATIGRALLPS